MIRLARASSRVRAALCAAALLSLFAAFGLHPEPTGSTARPAETGIAAKASLGGPAHDCIACLSGGSALAETPANLAPVASDPAACAVVLDPDPPARLACGSLSGRSPPAGASS
jgi:hypothetical protein